MAGAWEFMSLISFPKPLQSPLKYVWEFDFWSLGDEVTGVVLLADRFVDNYEQGGFEKRKRHSLFYCCKREHASKYTE
jgi:hypothetical protein